MRNFVNCFFETIYEIPTFSPKFRLSAVLFVFFELYSSSTSSGTRTSVTSVSYSQSPFSSLAA